MNQLRKAKSRNPRRHAVLPRKYIKVVVTYVLLFAIVFSNMSNPLLNVFAGQKKEEFRIHADELQRAAEEALEEGNIVEEPLDCSQQTVLSMRSFRIMRENIIWTISNFGSSFGSVLMQIQTPTH